MKGRFMLPREVLGVMGMYDVPFQGAIDNCELKLSDIRRFAGNGLHSGTVGAVVAWAAMNIR